MNTTRSTDSGIAYVAAEGGAVVAMWGEVDAALRASASDAMTEVLAHPGWIEIDVADVTFIDSSGLAFVLQLYALGREEGREVVLREPPEALEDLLAVIGMQDRIPVVSGTHVEGAGVEGIGGVRAGGVATPVR